MTERAAPSRCACHEWHPLSEIGGWHQKCILVRDLAADPAIWDRGRCELSREDLRERIAACGGVRCEHALSARKNTGGDIELVKGVHRWAIAVELCLDTLPVRVDEMLESHFAVV